MFQLYDTKIIGDALLLYPGLGLALRHGCAVAEVNHILLSLLNNKLLKDS